VQVEAAALKGKERSVKGTRQSITAEHFGTYEVEVHSNRSFLVLVEHSLSLVQRAHMEYHSDLDCTQARGKWALGCVAGALGEVLARRPFC